MFGQAIAALGEQVAQRPGPIRLRFEQFDDRFGIAELERESHVAFR